MQLNPSKNEPRGRHRNGFSFVELLVAIAIAAAVLTVAVLVYQAILQSHSRLGNYGDVALPEGVMADFYGETGTFVRTYFAPNFGQAARAEMLRESFYEDLQHSNAVFCLGRNGRSLIRPLTLARGTTTDLRTLDTPEAFRQFLGSAVPASSSVFTAYRGNATTTNLSIFVLMPSDSSADLIVRAVYELDFVPSANPSGTYASVRRYQGTICTDFYDVFYPASSLPRAFSPVAVFFEREARLSWSESSDIDRFKRAANRPFYFVWWPDPTSPTLEATALTTSTTGTARDAYAGMAGRTSFFMVFPQYPAL